MSVPQLPKAIFLDLEGPIVSHRSVLAQFSHSQGEHYNGASAGSFQRFADTTSMRLVINLAVRTGAKIVVTSTLRCYPDIIEMLRLMCIRWAKFYTSDPAAQMAGADLIHGITDNTGMREDEIKSYVEKFQVQQWVAIDDRKLKLRNFVQVDPSEGFSYRNFQKCKPFLVNDTDTEAMRTEVLRPEPIFL